MSRERDFRLCVCETHPVQYHAPVYRTLNQIAGVSVTAVYGSDFSARGYHDVEFQRRVEWDVDLLEGYESVFLSNDPAIACPEQVSGSGLETALSRLRPDAVLCLGYALPFHWEAIRAASRLRLPLFLRAETADRGRSRPLLKTALRSMALRALYALFEGFAAIGTRSRDHYLSHGVDPKRIVPSPYCVDTTVFAASELDRSRMRCAARQALGIGMEETVVLFSGKLSARKGPDLIARAVGGMPQGRRPVLLFVGEGEMREQLGEEAQRLGVRAVLAGFVNQRKLSPLFHASDILTLPSREGETWGLVVNEALHHGLPCVVTSAVGCSDDLIRVGVNGAVCEADDVLALRSGIETVAELARAPGTRERCRALVSAFSVDAAAKGIATLLDRIEVVK